MKSRLAESKDMASVYMMGFDVWGDGLLVQEYLDDCKSSPKYAKGTWYILEDSEQLLSSLITYEISENIYGIGSVATSSSIRNKGFASRLIADVIELLESEFKAEALFLFSDIDHDFYEKFSFKSLPINYQKHGPSVCMVRPREAINLIKSSKLIAPSYF